LWRWSTTLHLLTSRLLLAHKVVHGHRANFSFCIFVFCHPSLHILLLWTRMQIKSSLSVSQRTGDDHLGGWYHLDEEHPRQSLMGLHGARDATQELISLEADSFVQCRALVVVHALLLLLDFCCVYVLTC